jgi:hypothetical protein
MNTAAIGRADNKPCHGGGAALSVLIEGFDVFDVQIQFWMLLAALVVGAAIAVGLGGRRR